MGFAPKYLNWQKPLIYLCMNSFSNNYLLELCYCYLCPEDEEILLVPWELQLLLSALGSAERGFWFLGFVSLCVRKPRSAEDGVLGMGDTPEINWDLNWNIHKLE